MLRLVKETTGEREGSQAFLRDKRTRHNACHHRHPHQQPLLETLLRPPAFSRRILPEDFSEALLERETKTECKGLMAGHLMHSVTCMWKNRQVCTLPKNAPFKKQNKKNPTVSGEFPLIKVPQPQKAAETSNAGYDYHHPHAHMWKFPYR